MLRMQARRDGLVEKGKPVLAVDNPEGASSAFQAWRTREIQNCLVANIDTNATEHRQPKKTWCCWFSPAPTTTPNARRWRGLAIRRLTMRRISRWPRTGRHAYLPWWGIRHDDTDTLQGWSQ